MIDLETAKNQLKIFHDDEKVQRCLNDATAIASNFLDRDIPWTDEAGVVVEIPGPVRAAILLMTNYLYDHRNAGGRLLLPGTTEYNILYPFRELGL